MAAADATHTHLQKLNKPAYLQNTIFLYLFSMAPLDLFITKTSCVYRSEAITPMFTVHARCFYRIKSAK